MVFFMINLPLVRQCAEENLGTKEVRLVREIPIGREDCSLSLWAEAGPMPARSVAIFELLDEAVCTSADFQSFERLLKVLKPNLQATGTLASLIRVAAPGRMSMVDSPKSLGWLPRYEPLWHEPCLVGNKMEFFCADFASGRFIRVGISSSFDLKVEDIGPGKKLAIR